MMKIPDSQHLHKDQTFLVDPYCLFNPGFKQSPQYGFFGKLHSAGPFPVLG